MKLETGTTVNRKLGMRYFELKTLPFAPSSCALSGNRAWKVKALSAT